MNESVNGLKCLFFQTNMPRRKRTIESECTVHNTHDCKLRRGIERAEERNRQNQTNINGSHEPMDVGSALQGKSSDVKIGLHGETSHELMEVRSELYESSHQLKDVPKRLQGEYSDEVIHVSSGLQEGDSDVKNGQQQEPPNVKSGLHGESSVVRGGVQEESLDVEIRLQRETQHELTDVESLQKM